MNRTLFTDFIVHISISLSILIVLVNTVCIVVILADRRLRRKSPMVFIVNLLVTHLVQGLFVLPVYAIKKAKTYPPDIYPLVCDTWRLTYMLTFYGTCVNVFLVALDRYIATKYAVSQKIKLTTRRCIAICIISWLYMVLLCLIPFAPLDRSVSLQISKCNYNQPYQWTIYMLMANTVLPFLLVSLIYMYITNTLKNSHKAIQNSARERRMSSSALNRKLTTLTLKVTFTYGITWLPSIVYYNIVTIKPDTFSAEFYVSDAESLVTFFIKFITFFDAVLAPIIYCRQSIYFRRAFKEFRRRVKMKWL